MAFTYAGFQQVQGYRRYAFQHVAQGGEKHACFVIADIALFTKHSLKLQDGLEFCLDLLAQPREGGALPLTEHYATEAEVKAYAGGILAKAALRAQSRGHVKPRTAPLPVLVGVNVDV